MATYARTVRRGLPRRAGGEAWPAADVLAADTPQIVESAPDARPTEANEQGSATAAAVQLPQIVESVDGDRPTVATEEPARATESAVDLPQMVESAPEARLTEAHELRPARGLRRGLPRVIGGEPWPAASAPAAVTVAVSAVSAPSSAAAAPAPTATSEPLTSAAPASERTAVGIPDAGAHPLRRGLPRAAGGEPWPAAGFAPAAAEGGVSSRFARSTPAPSTGGATERSTAGTTERSTAGTTALTTEASTDVMPAPAAGTAMEAAPRTLAPLTFTPTVFPGTGGRARPEPRPEPTRYGPFTRLQWIGAAIVGGGGLLFAAGMAVLAVRWLLSLEPLQDFLASYPGEYHLPEGAPVGVPPWLGWQHFFNVFLMVLIIRTGLQVRNEKRPSVFWSPRTNPKRKISLGLWFHQSLDILWIVNGVIFVVLLFTTGQWMKIVPTSWEVFPNAISAALQYVSLDWPTENGWVNYNSLQQLAYFATVFVAAPLAIATGVRMSGIWPKNAKALNKAYPVEWARAVHFPVMLYFVFFIIVHVALVFATGALRNLNHMYASLGSTDGVRYADNWTGFWIFALSMLVIAAGWVAARPLVLAPIARVFGKVSGR